MNIKSFYYFILLFSAPLLCFGQNKLKEKSKKEIKLSLENHLYIHTVDFTNFNNYMTCKNTFGQTLGIDYSYILGNGLLISAGGAVGYERYKFIMNNPYGQSSIIVGSAADINTAIYSAALKINLGYRFTMLERMHLEIRLGMELLTALNHQDLYSIGQMQDYHYLRRGSLGKLSSFSAEPINLFYIGFAVPSKLNWLKHCSIGLELQKKLIGKNNTFNNFKTFFGRNGNLDGTADFQNHHTSIGIQVAYTF